MFTKKPTVSAKRCWLRPGNGVPMTNDDLPEYRERSTWTAASTTADGVTRSAAASRATPATTSAGSSSATESARPVKLRGRTRSVGRLENGGDPGQLLPPDALQLGPAGPGEDRLLAADELGVVARARRQIGDAAGRDHRIDPPHFLKKEDQRPEIDNHVVRGGENEPVVIGAAIGRHPQERALLEVERPSGIGDHPLPHHFEVGAGDIDNEDLRRQRRVDPLPQLAPLVGEGRPQRACRSTTS